MLGVFLGLVFVEQRHDLAHHDMHGVVAHLLGDGDEPYAVLGELADIKLELEVVAEETAEGMDDNHVEQGGFGRACLDHALELGTLVIGGGQTGIDIGFDQLIAARGAIGISLFALVGNGDIVLGLPHRRNAQVEGGTRPFGRLGRGHGNSLLVGLSAQSEQFIEEVAEPGLEYVHLGLGDRDAFGPVIADDPGREVVLRRTADARLRREIVVKIVGQVAKMRKAVTILAGFGAKSGHSDRIGPSARNAKNPKIRQGTPRILAQKDLHRAGPGGQSITDAIRGGTVMAYASRFVLGETASPRKTRIA